MLIIFVGGKFVVRQNCALWVSNRIFDSLEFTFLFEVSNFYTFEFYIGRLLSYADEHPSVKTLLEQVRERCEKTCHFLPLFSCLSEPVGPLIKIFSNFNGVVYSLVTHVSASGIIVTSALGDGLIKVHELETGIYDVLTKDRYTNWRSLRGIVPGIIVIGVHFL